MLIQYSNRVNIKTSFFHSINPPILVFFQKMQVRMKPQLWKWYEYLLKSSTKDFGNVYWTLFILLHTCVDPIFPSIIDSLIDQHYKCAPFMFYNQISSINWPDMIRKAIWISQYWNTSFSQLMYPFTSCEGSCKWIGGQITICNTFENWLQTSTGLLHCLESKLLLLF